MGIQTPINLWVKAIGQGIRARGRETIRDRIPGTSYVMPDSGDRFREFRHPGIQTPINWEFRHPGIQTPINSSVVAIGQGIRARGPETIRDRASRL